MIKYYDSTHPLETLAKIDTLLNEHTQEVYPDSAGLDSQHGAYEVYDDSHFVGGLAYSRLFDTVHVTGLALDSAYRHQGIGRQLMLQFETDMIQEGIHTLTLSTLNYQALLFYQKLGYQLYGEINDYPQRGMTKYHLYKRTQCY